MLYEIQKVVVGDNLHGSTLQQLCLFNVEVAGLHDNGISLRYRNSWMHSTILYLRLINSDGVQRKKVTSNHAIE